MTARARASARRAILLVVTVGLVAVLPLAWAETAAAAAAPPTTGTPTVVEAEDYASQNWADAWDFNNGEDFYSQPATGGGTVQTTPDLQNVNVGNGALTYNQTGNGYAQFGFAVSGAIPVGRDTHLHPINTALYNRLSMRVFLSAANGPQAILFTCDGFLPGCAVSGLFLHNETGGSLTAGWNTATLDLPPATTVYGLRLYAFTAGAVEIDWLRLYKDNPSSDVTVTNPASSSKTWWYRMQGVDCTTNPLGGSNPSAARDQGPINAGSMGAGASTTFRTSRMPPGNYCVRYLNGGSWSDPLAIFVNPRPQPVVIDPDLGGGDDWASAVRGDAWDYNQASDVPWCASCTMNVAGGKANGGTAGPSPNDPQMGLPLVGNLDANLYHRFTADVSFDGGFSLADAPGGGMNARLLWRQDQWSEWSNSDDIVVLPGANRLQFDLKTNPPSAINEPGSQNMIGWGGPASGSIYELRFDPHEDPGNRTWQVDDVRIARNDRGKPTFSIKYADNAWMAGAKAHIYVEPPGNPAGRKQIAQNLSVSAGTNTFVWNGTDVAGNPVTAPATWNVLLSIDHPINGTVNAQAYSTGPVDMPTQPVLPPGAPTGLNAVAGVESAALSWTAPASSGGAPITNYVVTVNPGGGQVVVGNVTSTTVTGLNPGVGYTFTVKARNSGGDSPPSNTAGPAVPTALPGARFVPLTPYRALDSRNATGGWNNTKLGQDQVRDVTVGTGGVGKVPADAIAVVMNVTVTGPTAGSFLTAYPSGAPRPLAANLNFEPGQTVPNLVTTKLGNSGKVSLYNNLGSTHVVADVVGYYTTTGGDQFAGMTPTRAADSRDGGGPWGDQPFGPNESRDLHLAGDLGIPADATAVVANVTATGADQASYLQASPAGSAAGVTANLLFGPNQTIPNLITVGIGTDGDITLFNQLGNVDVVVDIMGYYAPGVTGGEFHAVNPTRLLDSRTTTGGWNAKLGQGSVRGLQVAGANGIPTGATAAVINTTVTGGTKASFLSAQPAPASLPIGTANLLFGISQTVPNLVIVQVPTSGADASKVDMFNQLGSVHVIADASGYFI